MDPVSWLSKEIEAIGNVERERGKEGGRRLILRNWLRQLCGHSGRLSDWRPRKGLMLQT